MYSTDPVADASRHYEAVDALNNSLAQAKEAFAETTRKAFEDAYQGHQTMVEWVQYSGGTRVRAQSTREAVLEEMEYLIPQFALWKVLCESKCPLVAELKKAVADSYIDRNADEVAEMRAGS